MEAHLPLSEVVIVAHLVIISWVAGSRDTFKHLYLPSHEFRTI